MSSTPPSSPSSLAGLNPAELFWLTYFGNNQPGSGMKKFKGLVVTEDTKVGKKATTKASSFTEFSLFTPLQLIAIITESSTTPCASARIIRSNSTALSRNNSPVLDVLDKARVIMLSMMRVCTAPPIFAPTDCLGSGDARHSIRPPLDPPIGQSRHSTGCRIRCKSVLLPIRSLCGRHLARDCVSELRSAGCEQTGRGEGLGAEGGESAQTSPRPTSDAA
ncbi:hypothetical protein B0H14DRAFT_3140687 [Mycena olivaceomarginata]|nr:hypothetical protein B0H14DRAFT_3140687 [Mycena olivaceomarginata]